MEFCSKMAVLTILQEIERDSNKNVAVSPLSFNALLSMTAAGSAGPTLKQLLGFLGSPDIKDLNSRFAEFMAMESTSTDDDQNKNQPRKRKNQNPNHNGPTLCFINGAWVSKLYPLKESYKELVETVYKTEARNVDFSEVKEVVEEVNAWAKSATKGLISDVVKKNDITVDTRVILANALYFKGSWVKPFKCEETKDREFYLLNGGKSNVPFMTGCTKYSYRSFDGFKGVRIPYEAGEDKTRTFSMNIFLPNERDGILNLLQRVNSDSEFLLKHSLIGYGTADIFWIPKFKFEYSIEETVKIMKEMGLTLPFEEQCEDLTEMVCLPNGETLYISSIVQKAFIEIDEKGTEAAAVTRALKLTGCASPFSYTPTKFVAEHPFMFMVKEENSGVILFTGAVLNPLQT